MSDRLPKLPPRKAPQHVGDKGWQPTDNMGRDVHRTMLEQVAKLSENPAIQKLLDNPQLLEGLKERDPALKRLLEQSPAMSSLLSADKLRAMLELVADPARMRAEGPALFGGLDMTDERKALLQLDAYSRELRHAHGPHVAATGATPQRQHAWASGMRPPNQAAPFFSSQGAGGGDYQGNFSFSHSEREVLVSDLPLEAQQRLMAAPEQWPLAEVQPVAPGPMGRDAPAVSARTEDVQPLSLEEWQHKTAQEAAAAAARAAQFTAPTALDEPGRSGGAEAGALDYYEPVVPNTSWRPQQGEGCIGMYRRQVGSGCLAHKLRLCGPSGGSVLIAMLLAYFRHCDMLFFPPFFALTGLLMLGAPGLHFGMLVLLLIVGAMGGSFVFSSVLAGIPRRELAQSRTLLSLIGTCEVAYPLVFGWRVLPYWQGATSAASLTLLACFAVLPVLHIVAITADPGFIAAGQESGHGKQGAGAASKDVEKGAAAAAAAGPDKTAGAGDGGEADAELPPGAVQCYTCHVPRPLRAKHCQYCNRCVRRFDHHCPAIGNCVGEGNERAFSAWLFTMWVTQVLVIYVTLSFVLQQHLRVSGAAAASSAPDMGPAAVWAAVRWAASGPERAVLILAGLQALCMLPGTFLVGRQAFCILGNLTANELMNRHRYSYLKHEQGGYCNRFDRGPVANCFSFWLERDPNWWAHYDRGDREMARRGTRRLSRWSVGRLLTWLEEYNERREALTQAVVVDAPIQQRLTVRAAATKTPYPPLSRVIETQAPTDVEYDAVIVGGGMGGLATAARLVAKGAKVVVLEKYLLPGGSAAHYKREGYTFDVGSSMMFGMGHEGTTNLITKCLETVGRKLETVPDPTQVVYHLPKSKQFPQGLHVSVWRKYEEFIAELSARFPHEREGIRKFYDECWRVLNVLELKSLEEPRYLLGEFAKQPIACLTLASFLITNTGDVARKHIKDPELLRFIDIECFIWSTVSADLTPMINAGMVFCDRHYGGINYPVGGVGRIGEELAEGIVEYGGHIVYKANVKEIVTEGAADGQRRRAVGVRLADGRVFRGKTVISNATRWDTFENMIGEDKLPESEKLFRKRYKKSPSFLSIHMGVKAEVLAGEKDCHHIVLEDWDKMEGVLFVSMPTVLDPSLAPPGHHIVHAFTPDWIDNWQGLSPAEYEATKEKVADEICARLEAILPGLRAGTTFREVGTPRTHRRYLSREDGTYGPIPSRRPLGMLSMPFNSTAIEGLYCVGDSTFPGQGVNAVVFSGFGCAHRVLVDLEREPAWPLLDSAFGKLLNGVRDAS
ncbi:hypothetical protein GPECTOR_6g781 [Gonium pectorale]|uniref:prolycopene isomerase n=1 Tax=Gonium pectorale TaxID=33097 RepID=A0A150GVS6_GONPE|nr:hypothetical protein GPECTOR_6g781 [Gonium pectorale]|eukprot:KXZ53863.1 hypothetical protein GPECTOR_6g781 [Gonium pectorale]